MGKSSLEGCQNDEVAGEQDLQEQTDSCEEAKGRSCCCLQLPNRGAMRSWPTLWEVQSEKIRCNRQAATMRGVKHWSKLLTDTVENNLSVTENIHEIWRWTTSSNFKASPALSQRLNQGTTRSHFQPKLFYWVKYSLAPYENEGYTLTSNIKWGIFFIYEVITMKLLGKRDLLVSAFSSTQVLQDLKPFFRISNTDQFFSWCAEIELFSATY